ncbi:apolipoprotein N-acyltransferase [Ideonella sp.]|uniref:apolipoprotein N-acyltransferase n=1 Tax=Ideonella sp. TaxID=1929293 RepID=UPI002B460FD1|nr:apolipoprotein N-acyltransferase [Ideonella sp.]HJV70287.1 apolipoprotein N-acyltransferase [Ideonella sp.]
MSLKVTRPTRRRSGDLFAAAICGGVVGLCCGAPGLWPACLAALVGLNALVIVSSRGTHGRSLAIVAVACAAWHGGAAWWALLAVHEDGTWMPRLWQVVIVAIVMGSQALWFAGSWLAVRTMLLRSGPALPPSASSAGWAWCLAFANGDVLRQLGWTGDPYGNLAVALVDAPGVAGLLPWVGGQGVTWIAMALATALAITALQWIQTGAPRITPLACASMGWSVALAGVVVGWLPSTAESTFTHERDSRLQILAVQPVIAGRGSWSRELRDKAIALLDDAIAQAAPGTVIVTPESYLAEPPPDHAEGMWADLQRQIASHEVHLVVGMPQVARDESGTHLMNVALHLAPQRQSIYAKERLVPAAEYLPWPDLFGAFYARVFKGARQGEWPAPPELTAPLYVGGVEIGMSICHELSFASTMVERAADAGMLVNLSLDGWIPSAAYRQQMLSTARVRAMELGKPVLRVADAGGSVLFDQRGHAVPPAWRHPDLASFADVKARDGHTAYQRIAAWLAAAPVVATGLVLVAAFIRHRSVILRSSTP